MTSSGENPPTTVWRAEKLGSLLLSRVGHVCTPEHEYIHSRVDGPRGGEGRQGDKTGKGEREESGKDEKRREEGRVTKPEGGVEEATRRREDRSGWACEPGRTKEVRREEVAGGRGREDRARGQGTAGLRDRERWPTGRDRKWRGKGPGMAGQRRGGGSVRGTGWRAYGSQDVNPFDSPRSSLVQVVRRHPNKGLAARGDISSARRGTSEVRVIPSGEGRIAGVRSDLCLASFLNGDVPTNGGLCTA
ncbi:hypothetical protein EI94DRAFT_1700903 [Lactarius quietus]|nr:hypothetical protein EI94DRAFT_1700903 [Lactarius quietus]